MKLIGREEEIKKLTNYYQSKRSEFIALYGRRRVGKTYLIEQLYGAKFAFYVSGVIEGKRSDQYTVFLNALKQIGYEGKAFKTWYEAFYILKQLLEPRIVKGRRCILFIDELPCFDTARAGFVKAFSNFWNDWGLRHPEVMLIVCGSATTWMIKNLIDSHGGLHNRITHEMHIHPFSLSETEKYLMAQGIDWDRLSIMQVYSVMGGVPYYLSLIDKSDSASTAIDRLFFSPDADLKKEYGRLFTSLYNRPDPYIKIVELLCKKKVGMTREEIASGLGLHDNGHLTEWLTNLEKCDFIRLYHVKDTKGRRLKENDGLYQMMDFFTIFYHSFLSATTTDPRYWSNHLNSPKLNSWMGYAFERVCMYHIEEIKRALRIDRIGTEYFSWRSKVSVPAAQIDLIIERADRIHTICEIKYSENSYLLKKEEEQKIRNRVGAYKSEAQPKGAVQTILITTYGLTEGKHASLFTTTLTMDHLFGN